MDPPFSDASLRRAVRQYLEDLARSGVEQLPRSGPVDASTSERLAPRPGAAVDETAREAPPAATAAAQPAPGPESAASAAETAGGRILRFDPPARLTPSEPALVPPESAGLPTQETAKMTELTVLEQQVRTCTRCPQLVQNRSRTVFGVGDPNTRLCFFGEAPGADEDRLGEPFVGRAGQLLDRIIQACTLQRSDVYILNTLKCRPPGNRTPEPDEVENCRPFFERQLEIIQPEFICCLGLVAARALLDTKLPLGRLRGTFHPWRFAKVVVTYHPAYLLRNPDAKRHTWEDMQMLMRAMGISLPSKS